MDTEKREKQLTRRGFIRVTSAAAAAFFVPGSGFFACTNTVVRPQLEQLPSSFLTPLDRPQEEGGFYIEYVEGTSYRPTGLDLSTWTLQFVWRRGGEVRHTARLDYSEIASLFADQEESFCHTFQCVGNSPGGALVSTGVFTGVKLRTYLDHLYTVSPDDYKRVNFRCYDGYSSNHTARRVFTDDTAPIYLIYKFNGHPLEEQRGETLAHGFPVRILTPDMMGMKSPKALLEIEVTDDDSVLGYWESRSISSAYPNVTWSDMPFTKANSRIISPVNHQHVSAGRVTVAGFAWSGRQPVTKVEVGVAEDPDDSFGVKWFPATIDDPPSSNMLSVFGASQPEVIEAVGKLGAQQWPQPYVWCRWSATVDLPKRGKRATLFARATDSAGVQQPFVEIGEEIADGNNGIHSLEIIRE